MNENSLYPQYSDKLKKTTTKQTTKQRNCMLQQTTINYYVSWQLTLLCLYV